MSKPVDIEALRGRGATAIGLVMAGNAAMLALDTGRATAGFAAGWAPVWLGLGRLLALSMAGWVASTAARQAVASVAVLAACLVNGVVAVQIAGLRGDAETMTFATVMVSVGVAGFVPWSWRWQSALAVANLLLLGPGLRAQGLVLPPMVVACCSTLCLISVEICRRVGRSRGDLADLQVEERVSLAAAERRSRDLATEIEAQTRDLAATTAELAGFCQAASHDVRPPLRTMAGYAEILLEGNRPAGPDAGERPAAGIKRIAVELGEALDSLLDEVRPAQRALADTLSAEVEKDTGDARPSANGGTLFAQLRERAEWTLFLILGASLLATVPDTLFYGEHRRTLLAVDAVRALLAVALYAYATRASSARRVVEVAWGATALVSLHLPLPAVLRGDPGVVPLLVLAGLCLAVSALLPWGWRRQLTLAVVAVGTATVQYLVLDPASRGTDASYILAAVAMALSVPIAIVGVGDERRKAEARVRVLESAAWIRKLGTLLDAQVERRSRLLLEATSRLEEACETLDRSLRPLLAEVHRLAAQAGEESTGGEVAALVARIDAAATRMEATLEALLDYIELDDVELHPERVDLAAMVTAAVEELRVGDPDRRVEVLVGDDAVVWGDPGLLREAVTQLVRNAWKFTGGRDEARVEAVLRRDPGGHDIFAIRDDGIGFDERFAGKLFQPFMRLEEVEAFPGLGIGLARLRRIVELHGGRAFCRGTRGSSAEFGFTLPAQERDEAPAWSSRPPVDAMARAPGS